jgi:hypothetical protein
MAATEPPRYWNRIRTTPVCEQCLTPEEREIAIGWSWVSCRGCYRIMRWVETGGPPITPPTRQGFGRRVMDRMIRVQLNGQILFDWRAEGLAREVAFASSRAWTSIHEGSSSWLTSNG